MPIAKRSGAFEFAKMVAVKKSGAASPYANVSLKVTSGTSAAARNTGKKFNSAPTLGKNRERFTKGQTKQTMTSHRARFNRVDGKVRLRRLLIPVTGPIASAVCSAFTCKPRRKERPVR